MSRVEAIMAAHFSIYHGKEPLHRAELRQETSALDCCRSDELGSSHSNGGATSFTSRAYKALVLSQRMAYGMPILVRHRDADQYRHS
jgi:hypothetical protein